jgi:hypothetical protein
MKARKMKKKMDQEILPTSIMEIWGEMGEEMGIKMEIR